MKGKYPMKLTIRSLDHFLFNITINKRQDALLHQMLVAYRQESYEIDNIESLENSLQTQLYFPPKRSNEDFPHTLDAAILSLKGWLLAFSAVALLLLSFCINSKLQSQSNFGLDEILTYNSEESNLDTLTLSREQEYGH